MEGCCGFDELDSLQLDENNQISWKGEKIKTEVRLPKAIDWAAWLIVLFTGLQALADWVK
jgi:hypothetical protein